ncbi:MAG TPA: methylated-DNA--[protein]-cysteine S-methyltransferase [Frankiaceae bacterium]|nr:methylated-DNA--[protein]-cysteine S-methyltransferase [Frankiaceae bacterium]
MAELPVLSGGPGAPAATVERFLVAAAPLADVAVGPVDAPFGRVWVAVTERGLVRVSFDAYDAVLAELAGRVSPRVVESAARADAARRQLDAYFAGERTAFDLPLDDRLVRSDFQRRVLAAAAAIPYGRQRTYTEVATAAGNAKAVRAAGSALGANPLCIVVPCHRVLRAGGGLGGYAGGLPVKRWLLDRESDSRTLAR